MSLITSSLKEIRLKMSKCKTTIKFGFLHLFGFLGGLVEGGWGGGSIKSLKLESLP